MAKSHLCLFDKSPVCRLTRTGPRQESAETLLDAILPLRTEGCHLSRQKGGSSRGSNSFLTKYIKRNFVASSEKKLKKQTKNKTLWIDLQLMTFSHFD